MLPVVEIFGPTIQGEGPEVGSMCIFVRFGGCDYRCSWCDSTHAVLPEQVRAAPRLSVEDILLRVTALGSAPLVILSGGNPLLLDLGSLVDLLHIAGYQVSVETQGTQWRGWINQVDQVVVSPKPPSSGMGEGDASIEVLWEFLRRTTSPVALKVPCLDYRDVTFAAGLAAQFPGYPFFLSVVTLMGGLDGKFAGGAIDTTNDLLARYRDVFVWARQHPKLDHARILPQVHALAWGHEKGH